MKNGTIQNDGRIEDIIEKYLNGNKTFATYLAQDDKKLQTQILSADIINDNNVPSSEFKHDENINITFAIKNLSAEKGIRCNVALWDVMDRLIFIERIDIEPKMGYRKFKAKIPKNLLVPNRLKVSLALDIPSVKLIEVMPEFLFFEIVDTGTEIGKYGDRENGVVISKLDWSIVE